MIAAAGLWYFANTNTTSAQQSEEQTQQLVPSATFVAIPSSLGSIPDATATGPGAFGSPRDVQFSVTKLSGSITKVTVKLLRPQ